MKKWALLIVLVAGCRHKHLGPDVGVAYREAFATQEESEPTAEPTFGADVAHGTLGARKGAKAAGASSSGSSEAIVVPMSTTSTSSSGAWPGASGNISLEAK
jgi:hypothetical protein